MSREFKSAVKNKRPLAFFEQCFLSLPCLLRAVLESLRRIIVPRGLPSIVVQALMIARYPYDEDRTPLTT